MAQRRGSSSSTEEVATAPRIDEPIDVADGPADEAQVTDPAVVPTASNPGFEVVEEIPPIQQKKLAYDELVEYAFNVAESASIAGKEKVPAVRVPGQDGNTGSPTSAAGTIRKNYGSEIRVGARDGVSRKLSVETRTDPKTGVFSAYVSAVAVNSDPSVEAPNA